MKKKETKKAKPNFLPIDSPISHYFRIILKSMHNHSRVKSSHVIKINKK